jgi:RHS repeat-associated protein
LRVTDIVSEGSQAIETLSMSYTYTPDKQVETETFPNGSPLAATGFNADYDPGNRVTAYTRAGGLNPPTQTWQYDDNGNWASNTLAGQTENRTHNADNEITSGGTAFDARGNMTQDADGNEYHYDLDNRIFKIEMDNGPTVEHLYDATGRRVQSKQGSTKTAFLWWGDQECSEHKHQAGQAVIQNDLWAHPTNLNTIIARAVEGSKFKMEWYHKNYLDHVYAVTDDGGDIIEQYRYSAFGIVEFYDPTGQAIAGTDIANPVLWNSRRYDEATRLFYYKYRHYISKLGRWPARDPIRERGGLNLYGFVGNNGLNNWDQLGLSDALVKRSIYIMGGPDTKSSHPDLSASEDIFDTLNYYMFNNKVPSGYKYSRISEHDAPGNKLNGDPKLHQLTEEMLKFKNEWESANVDYKCCVDFKGTYFTGKRGDPLTPTVILNVLSNPKIKEYDRVMLAAHIGWMPNNETGLFLGAGTAPAGPSSSEIVDWGGVVPWARLFEGVSAMEVEIYTCFNHNVPKTSGNVTMTPKGEAQGESLWRDILPKHIKPWVESECDKNKSKK